MDDSILRDRALAERYFVTIRGIPPAEIIVPHLAAANTIEDNCNLLCRSLGIDVAALPSPPVLKLLNVDNRNEQHTLPFPKWDRSESKPDSNVAFLLKSIFMAEGKMLTPGGMRSRLQELVRTPYGLGALALIDKSPISSKAFSYALSKDSNKLRFTNGNERRGQTPILEGSPLYFRADFTSQRGSHVRTSVDMSDVTSTVDAYSRVLFAASFDAAMQSSISEFTNTPIKELQRQLYTSRDTWTGYFNRSIEDSVALSYQTVLLGCNELLDRGAVLDGSRDHRMVQLLSDVRAFREGDLREPRKDLAERAIKWSANSSEASLVQLNHQHSLNHHFKDGVAALQHCGDREGIKSFSELSKNMHSRRTNMADRSETYAYRKQRGGNVGPKPTPSPKLKRD